MKLNFITSTKCPVCGCDKVIAESVDTYTYDGRIELKRHTNGGLWEKRQFLCGYGVSYIPNFRSEQQYHHCTKDPVIIEEKERRDNAREKLRKFCDENNIPNNLVTIH